jgi:hypothetical protein
MITFTADLTPNFVQNPFSSARGSFHAIRAMHGDFLKRLMSNGRVLLSDDLRQTRQVPRPTISLLPRVLLL